MPADPLNLRARLEQERAAILGELEMSDHLAPGLLSLLGGMQLALMALAGDRGGGHGSKSGPMLAPAGGPPLHEVLASIACELEAWATGRAPKPQDLHALSEQVEQLAERALRERSA